MQPILQRQIPPQLLKQFRRLKAGGANLLPILSIKTDTLNKSTPQKNEIKKRWLKKINKRQLPR